MKLSNLQIEMLNYVNSHSGVRTTEVYEDVGSARDLTIIDTYGVLYELMKAGHIAESFQVGPGYIWTKAEEVAA